MNGKSVIQVRELSKRYGVIQAVAGISFDVMQGEIFGLLGPNGAGKTTTLSILEGLRKADSGSVQILGMDLFKNAAKIKSRLGVQLQKTSFMPDLTAVEQMELFSSLYGRRISRAQARERLNQVGLLAKADLSPENLSGGQQQRLALALALVNDAEIIFLDEPSSGLDPQSRRTLWDLIRTLRDGGRTILLTTHYMEEASTLCDRVSIIDHGKVLALDTPQNLIRGLKGESIISFPEGLSIDDIQNIPEILAVHKEGELIKIRTRQAISSLQAIMELASRKGCTIHDLHVQTPTLDDVFLDLTGHKIRDA